jgi:flagellar hook-associated protein 2
MAVESVRQGTVSREISELAAALLARERQPIQLLESRRGEIDERSRVLGTLKTRLTALRGGLDDLGGVGTLSPFSAKAATSSDESALGASAVASAVAGTLSVVVAQLARRATHASDLYTDGGSAISGAGAGTFGFTVTIGGTGYAVSVTIGAGEDDKTVLDNIAAAVAAAVGSKGSALRVQTETGKSRLSLASAETGTANKVTFTDTDGLLARIGLVHASATAATDTTGGYVYEDLGGHELDARLVVDGLTYYRASNTVSDLVAGTTLNLRGISANPVTVKVQPDADHGLAEIKDFIARYNDVLDYLAQQTVVDPKAGRIGPLALDPVFSGLAGQLRGTLARRVTPQAAGDPDSLAILGVVPGPDGKLAIKNETELRDTLTNKPGAVTALFSAVDGVATTLEAFVDGYAKTGGAIAAAQSQLSLRSSSIKAQIDRSNALLARRQRILEEQLARGQAVLQKLALQSGQIAAMVGLGGFGGGFGSIA